MPDSPEEMERRREQMCSYEREWKEEERQAYLKRMREAEEISDRIEARLSKLLPKPKGRPMYSEDKVKAMVLEQAVATRAYVHAVEVSWGCYQTWHALRTAHGSASNFSELERRLFDIYRGWYKWKLLCQQYMRERGWLPEESE